MKCVLHWILFLCYISILGCGKPDPECPTYQILATSSYSDPCISEGSIQITAPIADGNLYKLGSSPFQLSPIFPQLLPGFYLITIKEKNGCVKRREIQVGSSQQGPLFRGVKSLLAGNCVSCHGGANPQAGINFSLDCDIVHNWNRIKDRAVDGNPSPMPQGGLLPQMERDKITAWINGGHRYTD